MTASQNPFVWYELMTSDVPAAKRFYSGVVGWETEDVPMPDMTYTLLRAGGAQVAGLMGLSAAAAEGGLKPCWMGYVGVADVDAATAKAADLGGRIHKSPTDIPGVGRFAVIADRQGAIFQLFTPTQTGQRAVSGALGNVGWHELHTADWPTSFDFYASMFGWGKGDAISMGDMGTYQLFTIDAVPSGAMFNTPMPGGRHFWLYYFNVEDIDAATQRITDQGGKVMMGPMQVPGGSWITQAVDPQGAMFAVLGTRK